MDNAQTLIDIIDKRIDSYIQQSKILCRYSGIVVGKEKDKLQVQLLGFDTNFSFPYRPYVTADIGDYVFVECKINNLSNGIITDAMKISRE